VRCGSLSSHGVAWSSNSLCCGPRRCEWPEMLQLSCVPAAPLGVAELDGALKALLASMQMSNASFLFSNSRQPGKVGLSHIVFNVLPRTADVAELAALVRSLHNAHTLWGGAVSVHAPNEPTLARCPECSELGHSRVCCSSSRCHSPTRQCCSSSSEHAPASCRMQSVRCDLTAR
jgi:hypothetical protein